MNGDEILSQTDATIFIDYFEGNTNIEPTCEPNTYCDTTPPGQCAEERYCYNGELADNCNECGCPNGGICKSGKCQYEPVGRG